MRIERDWLRKLVFESPDEALLRQNGRQRLSTKRFTQDSPILPEVWLSGGVAYCRAPDVRVDLLLTPHKDRTASVLAAKVIERLKKAFEAKPYVAMSQSDGPLGQSDDAPLAKPTWTVSVNQTTVAASLTFKELIVCVLPLSPWWRRNVIDPGPRPAKETDRTRKQREAEIAWLARLVGIIALCAERPTGRQARRLAPDDAPWVATQVERGAEGATIADHKEFCRIVADQPEQRKLFDRWRAEAEAWDPRRSGVRGEDLANPKRAGEPSLLWSIALNRQSFAAIQMSVPATKSDAARRVFDISCGHLTWAVVDSGIDAEHRAFRLADKDDPRYPSRVRHTYDFTSLRKLLSIDSHPTTGPAEPSAGVDLEEADRRFKQLRERLRSGQSLDWAQLEPLIDISYRGRTDAKAAAYKAPENDHGTHVAGIIGACDEEEGDEDQRYYGVCPDISFYDLRVLDKDGRGEEFAVIAALQFIRYLNERATQPVIHGVNLSLSLLHDVENFACGRSPICDECDRLVASGVVVVAAAGNRGYERVLTSGGEMEAYRSISITDPGNAESVITVGATHRHQPHTYGVSYFSSRGPTGDGRIKPDLLGPGERVYSSIPGDQYAAKDGTSMAAPHVSGVAALLMARHREFMGHPARVKKILVSTATDLGRERYFQGAGMVDALRALQSV